MYIDLGIWYHVELDTLGILTLEEGFLWFNVGDFDYHFTLQYSLLMPMGSL